MNRPALSQEEIEMWRRIIAERPTQREKEMVFQIDPRLQQALPIEYEQVISYNAMSLLLDVISARCDAAEGNRTEFVNAATTLRQTSPRLRSFVDIYIKEFWSKFFRSPFPAAYLPCNFIAGEKVASFLRRGMPTTALVPRKIKLGIPQKNVSDFRLQPAAYGNALDGENLDRFIRTEREGTDSDRDALLIQVGEEMLGLSVEIFIRSAATIFELRHSLPALIAKCPNLISLELKWCQDVSINAVPILNYFFYDMPELPKLKRLELVAFHACSLEWFNFKRYFQQLEELELTYNLRRRTIDGQGNFLNLKKLKINGIGDLNDLIYRINVQHMIDLLDCPQLKELILDGILVAEDRFIQVILETTSDLLRRKHPGTQWLVNFIINNPGAHTFQLNFNCV